MNSRGGALPPNQPNYPEKPAFTSSNYAQGMYFYVHNTNYSAIMLIVGGVSFTFRKRWGQIDWRKLGESGINFAERRIRLTLSSLVPV